MDPYQNCPVRPGDVIAGKYKVERVLGMGGMGVVVAAMHVHLDQRVAIKFVLPGPGQTVERFLREAKAAVKLRSEHVAKVIDVGTMDSGSPYMVLEFLQGSDLSQLIEEHGALSVETASDYVLQACEAVAEAHSLGIVHRDLKPQNLFLTRGVGGQSVIKVLDFGISKMADATGSGDLTQTTSVMGSPVYMSPEQMRSSKQVVLQSDVWALGIVLQELLTLRTPFEADTIPELCLKVVGEAPRSPLLDRPNLPAEIVAIIARCLEKDPSMRYAHAAELATALEDFVPPASRVVAERARMVVTGMSHSTLVTPSFSAAVVAATAGTGGSIGRPSGSSSAPQATSVSTPSNPDSPKSAFVATASDKSKGSSSAIIAVAAAVACVALAAGAFFLSRGGAPAVAPPPPAAIAREIAPTISAPPVAPLRADLAVSVAPPAPPPTEVVAPPVVNKPVGSKPGGPAPKPKPNSDNDGIPSMR